MKIHIRKIRPEGMELSESFPSEMIELNQKDVLRFVAPIEVKAKITRPDNKVLARVTASSCYESFCSRCLKDVKSEWTTAVTLSFDVDNGQEFVEMDDDIRQELILNLPGRILCEADCKGLCIDCGGNLNEKVCEHGHAVTN